jgi:hypothetical protein
MRLLVPFDVSCDLRRPVPLIHGVPTPPVFGASMPEAPIHEHRYTLTPEHDVSSTVEVAEWPGVHAIAEA